MALTGAILPPSTRWAVSGDMRTCVIVMTEVLLALRRGGWVCCSPPPPVLGTPPQTVVRLERSQCRGADPLRGQAREASRQGRRGTRGLGLV